MRVALLLTLDPGLEREVEKAWGEEVCISLSSESEIGPALDSLEHSGALFLVDTTCFPPPSGLDLPVICIGEEAFAGFPLLERPLRSKELFALADALKGSQGASPELTGILPSPFAEFQRDAIHDLNNQFTTLQGNLMLLEEEINDPGMKDMLEAAKKSQQLIQWLEWLGEGEFSAKRLCLDELLTNLLPFFHRLSDRKTIFSLTPGETPTFVQVDPQRILALLLVLVHHLPESSKNCTFLLHTQQRVSSLHCEWDVSSEQFTVPDIVTQWAGGLRLSLTLRNQSWELSF